MPIFKQVYDDPKNSFDKILVPITDGRKAMQVTSVLHDVIESEGRSLISDVEKGISIAIIDDEWKNHLRAMDDLRQSVQGAVYEQKDPLLIYKFESFELFKGLVSKVNQEIVVFIPAVIYQRTILLRFVGLQQMYQSSQNYKKVEMKAALRSRVKFQANRQPQAHLVSRLQL